MRHAHLCGNVAPRDGAPFQWDESKGCGRIWFHDDAEILRRPRQHPSALLGAHSCPSCGRGGWWVRLPNPIGMQLTPVVT